MVFWVNILEKLRNDKTVAMLYVIESEGSSPGRAGFHMMVASDGEIYGSIGGGIMEHKLVEYARSLLKKGSFQPFIKRQIHQSDALNNKSGMICSGSQTIAFYFIDPAMISSIQNLVDHLEKNESQVLELTAEKVSFRSLNEDQDNTKTEISTTGWNYQTTLGFKNTIYIIGAGHVGLALSQVMQQLGFYIILADDRPQLNTFIQNSYAHQKIEVNYNQVGDLVPNGHHVYVAVVTFGYRSDELCIKQLIHHKLAYFGVMGSSSKMEKMFVSLRGQGYSTEQLNGIKTPIGLPIQSKTPMEIAISIAAQIISVKNNKMAENC